MQGSYIEQPHPDDPYTSKVLDKALALVDLVANGPSTLKELSVASGLNRTTVFRLLTGLERHGYVSKVPASGQYYLGPKLLELGCRLLPSTELLELARSALIRVVELTAETGLVSVRQGHDSLVIASQLGPQLNTAYIAVGAHIPLHWGAAKVLLAFAPRDFIDGYLSQQPEFTHGFPDVFVPAEQIRAELIEIRRRGYAVIVGEVDRDVCGISVPLRSSEGQVVASLAILLPRSRGTQEYLATLRDHLVRIGNDFSSQLGFRPA